MAALFTLGLLAKPTLVTLPLVLLLLDYWPLGRWRGAGSRERGAGEKGRKGEREKGSISPAPFPPFSPSPFLRLVLEKVPLLLLSAGCCGEVVSQTGNLDSLKSVPLPGRIANALVSYAVYLGQIFWPSGLAAFYPYTENLPAWQVAVAVLVLAVVSLAALLSWRSRPALLVGWLWYLGTLVPVIGLVKFARHSGADRYSYLSQIGLYIAVVWGLGRWERGAGSREQGGKGERGKGRIPPSPFLPFPLSSFLPCSSALLLAALMACAWQQTSYWQDSERLWTRALACTSNNGLAHDNLAKALAGRGRVDAAIAQYRQALEIQPDDMKTHDNLGSLLAGRGRIAEAMGHFQKALEIDPDDVKAHVKLGMVMAGRGEVGEAIGHYLKALEIQPDCMEAYNNLGVALVGRGQVAAAIAYYRKALDIQPDEATVHCNLGKALARSGRVGEAIAHFQRAVEIQPDNATAHYLLADALAGAPSTLGPGRGQVAEAIAHFRKALEIQPDNAETLNDMAWLRATYPDPQFRDGAEAVALARRAAALTPDRADPLDTLAAAYAEAGRFAEAVQAERKALDLARQQNQQALVRSIQAKLQLYQAGRAFHEPPRGPAETSTEP